MPTCDLCPPGLQGCHECCASGPHFYTPQRPYVPGQGARMETFEKKEITFRKGGLCGIPVRDGILKRFEGLEGRDSRPFEGVDVADQVVLRIDWPGYPPWSRSFRTRDSTPARTPASLSRLATDVCKSIEKFVGEMEGQVCAEPAWMLGNNHLNADNLALVSLQRASHGSWVASIRLL
ncbi:hypothetical protein BDM02DRAFT_3131066 [Thelephora ganbajun]|uniref:Uncharacterized protein n=1 Tax=Thelephora ganbajun TaxID=370292 RepID=A0ACB6Z753_THEGA|nr:hypothetical protein BDM02DRAFT_3131066 [Thelephora ganbajun]